MTKKMKGDLKYLAIPFDDLLKEFKKVFSVRR